MEIEFKFCIPPERLQALEAQVRSGPVQRTRLQARYFDTADGALAAAGMVLRLRKEGAHWVQTVKAAGDGPLQRWEHNVDLGAQRGTDNAAPDPRRHAGTPVGERLQAVLDQAGKPLLGTYATDIWRLTRVLAYDGARIELALDTGRIVARGNERTPRVAPVCELELELLDGDVRGLVAAAREWAQAHALWFSTVSKAERGERLLQGLSAVPAVKAQALKSLAHGAEGRALQQAAIANCLAQILPNASEIADGSTDAEQVHQLRIGLRRLRTALRELDALAPGLDPAWQAPLKAVFTALGAQRDQALVLARAQAELQAAGGPAVDWSVDAAALPAIGAAVRAPAFQGVLVALIGDGAVAAEGSEALSAKSTRRLLRQRLARLQRQVVRAGKGFASHDEATQHRVRRRLKRLRYLGEFALPLFKGSATARGLAQLRPAQDALGLLQDQTVALAAFRTQAAQDPQAWFGAGWFAARRAAAVEVAQHALQQLADVPPLGAKGV